MDRAQLWGLPRRRGNVLMPARAQGRTASTMGATEGRKRVGGQKVDLRFQNHIIRND